MKSKIITSKEEIERVIKKCQFCNLAMVDENNLPYVIPMNFGYVDGNVFLHSSKTGKKMDILKIKRNVCLSFSTDHELRWQSEKMACSYSMKYRSVLAFGKVEFIENTEKKIEALNCIMRHYTSREFSYNEPAVKEVAVYKVNIERLEGRVYGY
jgi:nitroimidazol reductase NimA-like FMN-containing flavoprotein (pyridoxamine 5'-phosphate oxidase superfamily)